MIFPPRGYDAIVATYGDPLPYANAKGAWESKILELFELPFPVKCIGLMTHRIRAHKVAGPHFIAVFEDIKAAGLEEEVHEYNGIYAWRAKRTNPRQFSLHTFGIAIDLNASEYPLGSTRRQHTKLIEIFGDHGFTYGGDFHGTRDPMHWQLASGF